MILQLIKSLISAVVEDVARYSFTRFGYMPCFRLSPFLLAYILSPRYLPIFIYRLSNLFQSCSVPLLPSICCFLNLLLFSIEISPRCHIKPGLFIPHPSGIVVGAFSIGKNATIFQSVTIGCRSLDFTFSIHSRPILGDNVIIGCGSKILGPIHVGNNSVIGANSVVLKDIPDGFTVVGIHS